MEVYGGSLKHVIEQFMHVSSILGYRSHPWYMDICRNVMELSIDICTNVMEASIDIYMNVMESRHEINKQMLWNNHLCIYTYTCVAIHSISWDLEPFKDVPIHMLGEDPYVCTSYEIIHVCTYTSYAKWGASIHVSKRGR